MLKRILKSCREALLLETDQTKEMVWKELWFSVSSFLYGGCSFTVSNEYGILKKRRLIILTLQQPFYHQSEERHATEVLYETLFFF